MTITLQLNLSPGDIRYAERTLPPLIAAHRTAAAEVLAVVDCCRPQNSKFVAAERDYPDFEQRCGEIRRIAGELLAAGQIDRLVYLTPGCDLIGRIADKYLAGLVRETHDCGGCGLMSYLAGIEEARSKYVLHYDADMLLHQAEGLNWAEHACRLLEREQAAVAVTPRRSPPAAAGPDAPTQHERRPLHPFAGGWRSDWYSTRCFLLQRERLEQFLPLPQGWLRGKLLLGRLRRRLFPAAGPAARSAGLLRYLRWRLFCPVYPPAPELLLFEAVGLRGGWMLNLDLTGAWLLHPADKGAEYLELLPGIIESVKAGCVPPEQRGCSDLILSAWRTMLSEENEDSAHG